MAKTFRYDADAWRNDRGSFTKSKKQAKKEAKRDKRARDRRDSRVDGDDDQE